ncbi:universal stress protein [Palleronia caenipelagi]|uniref:Universal stress protein n=1 Tax=Palleronia caenipelagi TaxID=2489174 RepID=A0A547Q846_9RHOB|nr:universal stress protein [Palleronia caenipelagi]TRD22558.1 universal stress protein [Palleronia caenipelagi]
MGQEVYVVAHDDDITQNSALDTAIARAQKSGASIVVVHILEWSPYSFLTPEELNQRHKRRNEELGRAEEHVIAPALARAKAAGVEAKGIVKHGNVPEQIVKIADTEKADFIIVGRSGNGGAVSRIFGSVPLAIAQIATVPTVIVP